MPKIVIFCMIFAIIVFGILNNVMENYIEKAIYNGYPGTEEVDVKLKLNLFSEQQNIFKIKIKEWHLDTWQLNCFEGDFIGVKVNWGYLFFKKILVVEDINKGTIKVMIDNKNFKKSIKKSYPGLEGEIIEKEIKLSLNFKVLGKEINTAVYGNLLPARGTKVLFRPQKFYFNGHKYSNIQSNLLNKFKITINLEKIPFTFQITTVKILQDKIIVEGKV